MHFFKAINIFSCTRVLQLEAANNPSYSIQAVFNKIYFHVPLHQYSLTRVFGQC